MLGMPHLSLAPGQEQGGLGLEHATRTWRSPLRGCSSTTRLRVWALALPVSAAFGPMATSDSKAWLLQHLQGIVPDAFEDRVNIFSVMPLDAPRGLERIWSIFREDTSGQALLTAKQCEALDLVLVIADPTSERQVHLMQSFVLRIDSVLLE